MLYFFLSIFQQDLDTRIIIGSFSYVIAAKIFCEVIIKHENFDKNERRKGRKIRRKKLFYFHEFFYLLYFLIPQKESIQCCYQAVGLGSGKI